MLDWMREETSKIKRNICGTSAIFSMTKNGKKKFL